MDKDQFDASVGLAFSLVVFERYKKSGLLQAELHHVPGIRGHCLAILELVEGKVISCSIEQKNGQRSSISKDMLVAVDNERGPFAWTLKPLPAAAPRPSTSPRPRLIAPIEWANLEHWNTQQKLMLKLVFDAIDGKKTIDDIKAMVPLSPQIIDEALRILLTLGVISF